jgi:Skp family chaperone for outer membrane proteins
VRFLVVNFSKVIGECNTLKQAQQTIQKKTQEYQKAFSKKDEEFLKENELLQKEEKQLHQQHKGKMSGATQEQKSLLKKRENFRNRVHEFQTHVEKTRQKMNENYERLLQKLRKIINALCQNFRKKYGAELVLHEGATVGNSPFALDITDQIIEALDQKLLGQDLLQKKEDSKKTLKSKRALLLSSKVPTT